MSSFDREFGLPDKKPPRDFFAINTGSVPEPFTKKFGRVEDTRQQEILLKRIKDIEKNVKELQEIIEESGKMSERADTMFTRLGEDLVGWENELEHLILGDGPKYSEEISEESNIKDPTYIEDNLDKGGRRGRHSSRKRRRSKSKRRKCKSKRKR